MLLAEAAMLSRRLKESYTRWRRETESRSEAFKISIKALKQRLSERVEVIEDIIDIFYPKYSKYEQQFVSVLWVRDNVCTELGISPIHWNTVMTGKPIVPFLATESSEIGGEGWTIKQALMAMHRIKDEGVLSMAQNMNEDEALLFWSRAMGEQEPMPVDRFLQMLSYLPESNGITNLQSIRHLLTTMSPQEVAIKILHKELVTPNNELFLQPGQPFVAPIFQAWTSMVAPSGVYADVMKGSRRYLHITEFPKGSFRGTVYSRDRQVVGKMHTFDLPFQVEAILEVEMSGDKITKITDAYSIGEDWEVYRVNRSERLSRVNSLEPTVPVDGGKLVESGSDIGSLLNQLDGRERLRLVKSGPVEMRDSNGWVVIQQAFHIHFLVSAIRKDEEFDTILRLSVLDGYETFEVGESKVPTDVAQHIRTRLGQQGVLAGKSWMPIDEYGLVVVAEVTGFDLEKMKATHLNILYADDTLGYSDTSQLTDLIELAE